MKRWVRLGGDESRTARHEAFWIALGSVLAGLGALLRFANHGEDHTVGWVLMAVAAWIALAFFFPLWLPRVRDADLIRERRERDKVEMAAIVVEMAAIVATAQKALRDLGSLKPDKKDDSL